MFKPLVPLRTVYHDWKGSITEEAIEQLKNGIERKRSELAGKPYLVLVTVYVYDYDGADTFVELLEGFADSVDAFALARRLGPELRQKALGGDETRVIEEEVSERRTREDSQAVTRLLLDAFMCKHSSYHSEHLEVSVLAVHEPVIVRDGLFGYLGIEDDMTYSFVAGGRA